MSPTYEDIEKLAVGWKYRFCRSFLTPAIPAGQINGGWRLQIGRAVQAEKRPPPTSITMLGPTRAQKQMLRYRAVFAARRMA